MKENTLVKLIEIKIGIKLICILFIFKTKWLISKQKTVTSLAKTKSFEPCSD